MTAGRPGDSERDHYSYAHYADAGVAEGFDALRFGGPIGRYLAECQDQILLDALAPLAGRRVLDVGTGTGRAAWTLARAGARVTALDASAEMLGVAKRRLAQTKWPVVLARADAQSLPIASHSMDLVVCLRLLMHVIDWRRTLAELCRVSARRLVVDFPSARSFAALEAASRARAARAGRAVEAYRVFRPEDVETELVTHGFRVLQVHRQFVLPIAAHKAVGRVGVTRFVEGGLAAVGALRRFGSPVTMVAER